MSYKRNPNIARNNRVPLKLPNGKITCFVDKASHTLKKSINGSKSILRTPVKAIAFAEKNLREAYDLNVNFVEVLDKENSKVYKIYLHEFIENAFPVERGGYERQLACPLDLWHEVCTPTKTILVAA